MNLIDRDDFKSQTLERHCAECNDYNGALCRFCEVQDILDEIDNSETIDAVPVVHGEWSSIPIGLWQCTRCAKIFDYAYNFCPNCGADMRRRNDDV